ALVFGANGQDGHYLVEELRARGIDTVGVSRAGPWQRADVARREDVEAVLRAVQPSLIFQLAANSTTRHEALFENHETISTGAPDRTRQRRGPGAGRPDRGQGVDVRRRRRARDADAGRAG